MTELFSRASTLLALALPLGLAMLLVPLAAAQAPSNVLSRENLVVAGTLAVNSGASYTVKYLPQLEGGDKPSPWVLRLYYYAPGAVQGSIGFTWLDQTDPMAPAATTGSTGASSVPNTGGNGTQVPPGTDTSNIQQAVLSGGGGGNFVVNVFNNSNGPASYTLRLFPLAGGVLEPGLNPNAAPVQPTATPLPSPAAPPQPAAPPPPPPFTPYWVKTLVRGAQLYSNATSPPAIAFGSLPQFTCLQVVQPQIASRVYVLNPTTGNFAYANADEIGGLAASDKSCG